MFRKFQMSNRLPNRYIFRKLSFGAPDTDTVICHAFAYSSRWRWKPYVTRPIQHKIQHPSLVCRCDFAFMQVAHNPERASPLLGLCHGLFTDQFIFRYILEPFYLRKCKLRSVPERIINVRNDLNVIRKSKLLFWQRGFGFDDRFVGPERYS